MARQLLTIRTNRGKKRRGLRAYAMGAPRATAPKKKTTPKTVRKAPVKSVKKATRGKATRVKPMPLTDQALFAAIGGSAGIAANVALDNVDFLAHKITDPTMYKLTKAAIVAVGAYFAAGYVGKKMPKKEQAKWQTAATAAMGLALGQAALTVYNDKIKKTAPATTTPATTDTTGQSAFLPRGGQVANVANIGAYAARGIRSPRGVGYINPSLPTGTRDSLMPSSLDNFDNAFSGNLS